MSGRPQVRIHPTAEVSDLAEIGPGTSIWNQCQVREHARIGSHCVVGKDVYIDRDVSIGDNVKIQNGAQIYHGVTLESGVFVGPGVIFTNDRWPRAINSDGSLKSDADWAVGSTRVCHGAAVGAGAIVLPDLIIGRFALVAAGAVVTRDVPDHRLVMGNPARPVGYVCRCAAKLAAVEPDRYVCGTCAATYTLPER